MHTCVGQGADGLIGGCKLVEVCLEGVGKWDEGWVIGIFWPFMYVKFLITMQ